MTSTSSMSAAKRAVESAAPPIPIVSVQITDADVDAVVSVLRTGRLAQGAKVAEFEQRFAEATGAKHAIACANGTCALQLAYELAFEPGDEVLVCAWGYVATASMIIARGATPVFVDVDPRTYCMDPEDAAKRITPKTRALVATHLYGAPADVRTLASLAKDKGLTLIYDAAQAHFATAAGRGLGAFGAMATYSLYATKNMTTGEGGFVTTNDDDLARDLRLLRSHGETEKYLHERVGYNYRMTDVEAALGCSQLDRAPALAARRRENAAALTAAITEIEGLHAPETVRPDDEHVFHQYAVRMDLERFACDRNAFCDALRAEGVSTALHYPRAISQQPIFEKLRGAGAPVAESLASCVFCLPVHPALSKSDLERMAVALRKVASASRR